MNEEHFYVLTQMDKQNNKNKLPKTETAHETKNI